MRRQRKKPTFKKLDLKKFRLWAGIIFLSAVLFFLTTGFFSSKLQKAVGRTNIVITGEPTFLISFPQSENDSLLVLSIPGEAYVQVPQGYGNYQLQNVSALGQLEKKPQLVAQTVADTLGIYVNGYVDMPGTDLESDEVLNVMKNFRFLGSLLRGDLITDLNHFDRLMLWRLAQSTGPLSSVTYDLTGAPLVFKNEKLPDGTDIKLISGAALDNFLANKFELTEIREQNLSIRIANTTDTPGVGQKFSRYMSHLGGKVLSVDNSSSAIAGCRAEYLESAKESILLNYLHKYFNCELIQATGEGIELTVYLGTDFAERWR